MKSVPIATFAERVAWTADGFSGQRFKFGLNLRCNIFVEGTVRANFLILKTPDDFQIRIDDSFFAGVAPVLADSVLRAVAAAYTILVAGHAFS